MIWHDGGNEVNLDATDALLTEAAEALITAEADGDGWRRIAEDGREALEGTQGQLRDANAAVLAAEAERDEAILIAELNRRDKIEWKSRALAAEARLSAIEGGGNEGASGAESTDAPAFGAAEDAQRKSEGPVAAAFVGPVAWRYRYVRTDGAIHWTLTQRPTESHPARPGWCARISEPLFILPSEAPSPQSEARPGAGNPATDQSNTSPTSQSEGEAS